jgi:hypothetical protein
MGAGEVYHNGNAIGQADTAAKGPRFRLKGPRNLRSRGTPGVRGVLQSNGPRHTKLDVSFLV